MGEMSMDKTVSDKNEMRSQKSTPKHRDRRDREYLYRSEINRLIAAAKGERESKMWYCLFLLMYRHAFRCGEIIKLKWSDIDFESGQIKINRIKGSLSGIHPLEKDEIKALKVLFKNKSSNYVFISVQGKPISDISVRKAVLRIGKRINLPISVHPHMIRHSAAVHFLENVKDIFLCQQFLGHKNLNNTLVYLHLTPGRLQTVKEWYKNC